MHETFIMLHLFHICLIIFKKPVYLFFFSYFVISSKKRKSNLIEDRLLDDHSGVAETLSVDPNRTFLMVRKMMYVQKMLMKMSFWWDEKKMQLWKEEFWQFHHTGNCSSHMLNTRKRNHDNIKSFWILPKT